MVSKILLALLAIILLTSCAEAHAMGRNAPAIIKGTGRELIIASKYIDEVTVQSNKIDDLLGLMQRYDSEAMNASLAGKLDNAAFFRGETVKKAREIESISTLLEQSRPPNMQFTDDATKLMNAIAVESKYAQLVNTEDLALGTALTEMKNASGESSFVLRDESMKMIFKEFLCLNLEKMMLGQNPTEADYAEFFKEKALSFILPLELTEFIDNSKSVIDFAKEVSEGTSFEVLMYKARLNQACVSQ